MKERNTRLAQTSTHWGAYQLEVQDGRVVDIHPFAEDPDPSSIGRSIPGALTDGLRIPQPMIRKGWLDKGPQRDTAGRGGEPFVAVSWDEALERTAAELSRVRETYGNEAIYGGSFGWSSAGRFHHAQSQLHRFLNCMGGYTYSVNSYSVGAAQVIVPHVAGPFEQLMYGGNTWDVIAEHTDIVLAIGGLALKNSQIHWGGLGRHVMREAMATLRDAGLEIISVSPIRKDTTDDLNLTWLCPRPNTDVAVMMGLAHTLVSEGLSDEDFLARYCVGFDRFRAYLTGEADGQPKDADWAAAISGLEAETLRQIARRLAKKRTLITISWSLQRADHGEQPYWMVIALACMLGQIGLPGGGFGFGYGALNGVGNPDRGVQPGGLPQGKNEVSSYIPVARIADLLLDPGGAIEFNGKTLTLPDIRLVYWCGGNPFHHHQNLNRLLRAWRRPETIIVHEPWWNASARHADIVLPAATPMERNDIGAAAKDSYMFAMQEAVPPFAEARTDYDIFTQLAERLGIREAFTEGRDEQAWLRHLYAKTVENAAQKGVQMPSFDEFWAKGHFRHTGQGGPVVMFEDFRRDPDGHPLKTPSGKFEIFSQTIADFGYDDCPGHPAWLEPAEWLGSPQAAEFPLHLISNQPITRLHSQYDNGINSREGKVAGREPVLMHPDDCETRGIRDGDVVRLFNSRGSCLAGAVVTDAIRPGVVQLATGAWYDPEHPGEPNTTCVHGNPNVLTLDKGTSRLAQGASAQSCLVQAERLAGEPPPVKILEPPTILQRRDAGE